MKIITSQRKTERLEARRKEHGPEKNKIKICKSSPINNYSNVNGLNSPIKRPKKKKKVGKKKRWNLTIHCPQETHFSFEDIYRLKVKWYKAILCASGNQKATKVIMLIANKMGFNSKAVTRGKEGHYIIKVSIHQENRTVITRYALNKGELQVF